MSGVSKAKSNLGELEKSIVKLIRRVAQINTLPDHSRDIPGIVTFEDLKGRHVAYSITRKVIGDKGSWVMVNRDKPLWNEIVARLCDLKPEVYSKRHVEGMLSAFVWKFQSKGWKLSGILKDAKTLISAIEDAKGETKKVSLPVWGLVIKVPSFVVGEVEFIPRTKDVVIDERLREYESARNEPKISVVNTIAVTQTTGGDPNMIVQNAEAKVNQALNIIRAFLYPSVPAADQKQIGIMGSFYTLSKLYFAESISIGGGKPSGEFSGGELYGVTDFIIGEYVTKVLLSRRGFDKLNTFLTSSKISPFQRSLLRGAEWLGEATKPDTLESKFLKVAFAVDAILGEEKSDKLPDKGIRARIAERSAFLLGSQLKSRDQIYNEMRDFIDKRNKLAHGSKASVSEWELERFSAYGFAILERLLLSYPKFKSIEQLDVWVLHSSFRG